MTIDSAAWTGRRYRPLGSWHIPSVAKWDRVGDSWTLRLGPLLWIHCGRCNLIHFGPFNLGIVGRHWRLGIS